MFRIKVPKTKRDVSLSSLSGLIANLGVIGSRISCHNSEVLLKYLYHFYPLHTISFALQTAPRLPELTTALLESEPKALRTEAVCAAAQELASSSNAYAQFFVSEFYIKNVLKSEVRKDAPPPCVLPLPFVDSFQEGVDGGGGGPVTPRFHHSIPVLGVDTGGRGARARIDTADARKLHHISAVSGFEAYDLTRFCPFPAASAACELGVEGALASDNFTNLSKSSTGPPLLAGLPSGQRVALPAAFFASEGSAADVQSKASCTPVMSALSLAPRDGERGTFYRREDVVENLVIASSSVHLNLTENPFWVRDTHPQLHNYLRLKGDDGGGGGGAAACVSIFLSDVVFLVEDLQRKIPPELLNHRVLPVASAGTGVGVGGGRVSGLNTKAKSGRGQSKKHYPGSPPQPQQPPAGYCFAQLDDPEGFNIFSGFKSQSSFFYSLPQNSHMAFAPQPGASTATALAAHNITPARYSGAWASLAQLRRYGLRLRDGSEPVLAVTVGAPEMGKAARGGTTTSIANTTSKATTKTKKNKSKSNQKDNIMQEKEVRSLKKNPFAEPWYMWTGEPRVAELASHTGTNEGANLINISSESGKKKNKEGSDSPVGVLVAVDELKLYNAQQLAVPGRLALRQALRKSESAEEEGAQTSLFQ